MVLLVNQVLVEQMVLLVNQVLVEQMVLQGYQDLVEQQDRAELQAQAVQQALQVQAE